MKHLLKCGFIAAVAAIVGAILSAPACAATIVIHAGHLIAEPDRPESTNLNTPVSRSRLNRNNQSRLKR